MFLAVLRKELITEIRTKEVLSLIFTLQLLLALILGLGLESAYLNREATEKVFPALFFVLVNLTAAIGLTRSSEGEFDSGAILGIAIMRRDLTGYFAAKALFSALLLLICSVISGGFLAILLAVPFELFWSVLKILPILSFGLSSILTLLAPLSFSSRLKGLILPIIALPCTIPLLLLSIEESYRIINFVPGMNQSSYLPALLVFTLLYNALGTRLFRSAIIG